MQSAGRRHELTAFDLALLRQGLNYGAVWAFSPQATALINYGLMWRAGFYAWTKPEGEAALMILEAPNA